jgi:hypothetical protein
VKPWTENQRSFISQHLQVDMTAAELARFFHVAPQDIWQLAREEQWPASPTMGPIALHTPGGGGLLTTVFSVPGATRADLYEPEAHDDFQRRCRPHGWVRR